MRLSHATPLLLLLLGASDSAPRADTATSAARFCVLHDFGVPKTTVPYTTDDPVWPSTPGLLAEGADGWIYSTSPQGGVANRNQGTIWRIDPKTSKLEVVHSFNGATGADPHGGLIKGSDGYLYGTTYGGGAWGFGTVFRIKPGAKRPEPIFSFRNGKMTGLKPKQCDRYKRCVFTPKQRLDAAGSYPISAPVLAADGNLYGVTSYSNNQAYGVLYRVSPTGRKSKAGDEAIDAICIFDPRYLYKEKEMAPYVCDPKIFWAATVTLGNDGRTIFGTTIGNFGTVWKVQGYGFPQVLHQFSFKDGSIPVNVMQASDNYLYGTTRAGGKVQAGTVFRVSSEGGEFETLTHFELDEKLGNFAPGLDPAARLIEKLDTLSVTPLLTLKYLYGAARFGGKGGRGTLFRLLRDGDDFSIVHHFPNSWIASGRSPLGGLLLDATGGTIYGTTYQGGTHDHGVVYRVNGTSLEEVPDLSAVPQFIGGVVAQDAQGKPLKDNIVKVSIGVGAYQGRNPDGTAKWANGEVGGIRFDVTNCRNAHLVQFIYREEIMAGNPPRWRSGTTPLGYALTTSPQNPVWDVDVGRAITRNAYWEQVPGNPAIRSDLGLTMFDQPTLEPIPENADKLGVEDDTRRASFRTYVFCNCELTRLISWTREKVGRARPHYTGLSLTKPPAADLQWINGLLQAQKFMTVP